MATNSPLCITAIRSHSLSASCMSWVVRITVVSWVLRTSSTKSCTSRLDTGSSPVVGSSSSRATGAVIRARAIATFCCIPRERFSSGTVTFLCGNPSRSRIASARRLPSRASSPYSLAAYSKFSRADNLLKKAASTDTLLMHRRTASLSDATSCPKTVTVPESGVSRVAMSLTKVDFPDPLGPRMPNISPLLT